MRRCLGIFLFVRACLFRGVGSYMLFFMILMSGTLTAGNVQREMFFDTYTQADGLPNNHVQYIFQDRYGWMWIGTSQGVSRYDGYEFTNFLSSRNDSSSLKGSLIRIIFEDRKGNLYFGTENGALNRFNRDTETFEKPFDAHPYFSGEVSVNDICQDDDGNLWVATQDNVLIIEPSGNIKKLTDQNNDQSNNGWTNYVRELSFDNTGRLWAGTNSGLYIIDPITKEVESFDLPFADGMTDEIWEIFSDRDGFIWVGTYLNGLFLIDPLTLTTKKVELEPVVDRSETVRAVSMDSFGQFWIGTRGGLYLYKKEMGVVGYYRSDECSNGSLVNNSILDIYHDKKGETWIGTRGGLNLLGKSKQAFRNFSAQPSNNRYLNSSIVYAFWEDADGKLWVGTEDGGVNIYNPETGTYKYLMADSGNPNSLSRNCIKAFQPDSLGNLWIGSFWGGVDILNLESGKITNLSHDPRVPSSLLDDKVMDVELDYQQNIWVASWGGLDRVNPQTYEITHFDHLFGDQVNWVEMDSKHNLWMGTPSEVIVYNIDTEKIYRFNEYARSVYEDSKGRFWVATVNHGLAMYELPTGAIKYYDTSKGLANNQALCILEDSKNNLWVSTTNGLSEFVPETEIIRNYNSKDGLRNNQFSYGAALKRKDGTLVFGGISGFNIFDPAQVQVNNGEVPLVFTDFRILNREVKVADGENAVLKKNINETEELVLDYDQKVITFEFAALNYINSERNLYSYYLEGFDHDWNEPSTQRTATYTNLDPGNYILRIKRVVPGVKLENAELSLPITILPPFWRTTWFRSLVLFIVMLMIFALIQLVLYREKMKNDLVLERLKAKKMHELDMLKLRFFTNISHEIRTPLTLILAPLEKLKNKSIPPEQIDSHVEMMYRNTKQLDRLINQLLDYRKLETGNLKLELSEGDIVRFIDEVVHSFDAYAEEKEIKLSFKSMRKSLMARFDPDKLEKIVNNLLSNAVKFTSKGGSVRVYLSLVFDTDEDVDLNENTGRQFVQITVSDSGPGIAKKNLTRVFNRFFQDNDENRATGTGIGLAYSKELIELHGGKIFVDSKVGKGTKFTVWLPYVSDVAESSTEDNLPLKTAVKEEKSIVPESSAENTPAKILLVVEDNPDVRNLLKSHFSDKYKVVEAGDGKAGWEKTLEIIPDIIISDVLMPDADGYEFCKWVKSDERTSHIPVLLLTALKSRENEIEGLSCGADDYITKPFDLSILETKINNIAEMREALKKRYAGNLRFEPENVKVASPDEKFMKKVMQVAEKNIPNSELDIEKFAAEVGVSRMQLYRKLSALTDMTVKEFIRNVRLKRAVQLLEQKTMTVSEVAYAVGFKDLSHFRKCFKQQYGMSASEYSKNKQG